MSAVSGFIALLAGVVLYCQAVPQTIPELLSDAKQSLGRSVEIETGPPSSVDAVIRDPFGAALKHDLPPLPAFGVFPRQPAGMCGE